MTEGFVIGIFLAYLAFLFGIAWLGDRRANWVNHSVVYSLSLAVYCTAWTFFGSVGRAATSGIAFLPIYLGPTIAAPVWILILRKIIVVSKSLRLTSVSDFISSRYGKSTWLGVLATSLTVLGIIPYISIQLKAIASGFDVLISNPSVAVNQGNESFYAETSFYITIFLAVFAILFGTRHLDPNERHEGLVAAIAFESVLKLMAFLAVGIYVTYGLFDGFGDLFSKGRENPDIAGLFSLEGAGMDAWHWFWLNFISLFAVLLLPRQFHMAVVENVNTDHVAKASWLFPLYLLLINLFVLPIAVAGLLLFPDGSVEPDTFVLALPLATGQSWLALLGAIGGFSAATSMVVVATIALSIMISNNLVLPFLLNREVVQPSQHNITERLLGIRRLSIIVVLLMAYGYYKLVGENYSLVSIGLISFTAVAQFIPAVLAGLYWKRATKMGVYTGLIAGFLIWSYTLPLPTLANNSEWMRTLVNEGAFGLSWLRPYALLGMLDADPITHSAFWSLTVNAFLLVVVSLYTHQSPLEISQANFFVDIYKYRSGTIERDLLRRQAPVSDIRMLLSRFLGEERSEGLLKLFGQLYAVDLNKERVAGATLVNFAETQLAGAIGAASAKIIISSVAKEDPISLEEVLGLLDQTQEIFRYSRELEQKSAELEQLTTQLQHANDRLKELDLLKADFITTVTHELRTPITSIKALANILNDNDDLPEMRRKQFLQVIISESERITRLINQVLDLERLQSVDADWELQTVDLLDLAEAALRGISGLMEERGITCEYSLPPLTSVEVAGNRDRLMQVIVNLLSNAVKFCPPTQGHIRLLLHAKEDVAVLEIIDNGPGIPAEQADFIFEKFTQISDISRGKPSGSGLGLFISRLIVQRHAGTLSLANGLYTGAHFIVRLPLLRTVQG
jgi:Na+/proline symporter/nitrogen-specific signal transduction histidine kinase